MNVYLLVVSFNFPVYFFGNFPTVLYRYSFLKFEQAYWTGSCVFTCVIVAHSSLFECSSFCFVKEQVLQQIKRYEIKQKQDVMYMITLYNKTSTIRNVRAEETNFLNIIIITRQNNIRTGLIMMNIE